MDTENEEFESLLDMSELQDYWIISNNYIYFAFIYQNKLHAQHALVEVSVWLTSMF